MTSLRALLLIAACVFAVACQPRVPPTRGEVTGVADAFLQSRGQSWGDPVEVLPPTLDEHDGRSWWQLRYSAAADGSARIVLVDDSSLWAREPPPGWRLRLPAKPGDTRSATGMGVSLRADPGSWILMVSAPETVGGEMLAERERRVIELNAIAGRSGLLPLFSLRRDRGGRSAIVYGWQGDSGVARDERLREWVDQQIAPLRAAWIDLSAAP